MAKLSAILFGCVTLTLFAQSDPTLAVEAITRLQNIDLEQNAKIKETVYKLLDRTRGTPSFLKLVKHFKISGQEPALIELAIAHPADETGVEALRMVLSGSNRKLIEQKLRAEDQKSALALVEALGNSGSKEATTFLLPIVEDEKAEAALRKQAERSLAKIQNVQYSDSTGLHDRLKPELRTLPPLAELLKQKGNVESGRRVFHSQTAACASCHKVKGQGTEVGPDLSEIGSKLAKEALYESILDPSAGISFGYEAWQLELKNGDEAYGLLASETAEEVAIKNNTGIVTRYKKTEIKSRQQMKLSIMPSGLQQGMTTADLVDLIEYLASLKKAAN